MFLKHVSPMNDIGYPFFKNMSFKNANSLSKLVQLEQTNWKTSDWKPNYKSCQIYM